MPGFDDLWLRSSPGCVESDELRGGAILHGDTAVLHERRVKTELLLQAAGGTVRIGFPCVKIARDRRSPLQGVSLPLPAQLLEEQISLRVENKDMNDTEFGAYLKNAPALDPLDRPIGFIDPIYRGPEIWCRHF